MTHMMYSYHASVIFFSAKIKNIIQTEEAKAKLLAEQRNKKKDHGTSFVPTNIAVNYVQHNRCELINKHTRKK